MNKLRAGVGITLATGLLMTGCSSSPEITPPSKANPTVAECIPKVNLDFVGYWALHMDGLHVASIDTAKEQAVITEAVSRAQTLRQRIPGVLGLSDFWLRPVLTHEQFETDILGTGKTDTGPGSIADAMRKVKGDILSVTPYGASGGGPVDTSVEGDREKLSIDPSVPMPNEQTAYVQLSLLTNTVDHCLGQKM